MIFGFFSAICFPFLVVSMIFPDRSQLRSVRAGCGLGDELRRTGAPRTQERHILKHAKSSATSAQCWNLAARRSLISWTIVAVAALSPRIAAMAPHQERYHPPGGLRISGQERKADARLPHDI